MASGARKACLKVDLKKAYDSVNRECLWHALKCMGFNETWIRWMKLCVGSPSFSILVNGSPSGLIISNRGLRQGDPLSPYLFTIVMGVFSVLLELEVAKGKIDLFRTGSQEKVSHLIFADDLLVFCKGEVHSLLALEGLFAKFTVWSGLAY